VVLRQWYSANSQVNTIEERKSPRTVEEEIAAKTIRDSGGDPNSIQFDRWGPHLDTVWPNADLFGLPPPNADPAAKPAKMIRVVFRGKNKLGQTKLGDFVCIVQSRKVVDMWENKLGDEGWLKLADEATRRLKEQHAAKNVPRLLSGFNRLDPKKTLMWLRDEVDRRESEFRKSYELMNALVRKTAADRFETLLNQEKGTKITWRFEVFAIGESQIALKAVSIPCKITTQDRPVVAMTLSIAPVAFAADNKSWFVNRKAAGVATISGVIRSWAGQTEIATREEVALGSRDNRTKRYEGPDETTSVPEGAFDAMHFLVVLEEPRIVAYDAKDGPPPKKTTRD
jgi:hypothetical protein